MAAQEVMPGMEGIAKREITPQRLIDMIAESGDVDKLATLLDLKLRWDAAEAKKSFDAALEAFRANKVVIEKTKKVVIPVKNGGDPMCYSHAELDKAEEIISDALRAVGLTHTWKPVANTEGKPQMSLVLRGFGHTEEMGTLIGPPDLSGGKNAMQAIGSSASYLARYVLLYSLGIVPKGTDDDGRAVTGGLSESAISDYCVKISDSSNVQDCMNAFQEAWQAAGSVNDKPARDRIRTVYEAKKKFFAQEKANGKR